jgi:lysophospholipase L1-like esterase
MAAGARADFLNIKNKTPMKTNHSLLVTLALLAAFTGSTARAQKTTVPDDRNYRIRPEFQTMWEDYNATKMGKPIDLIFIGDSITQQWRWGAGRPVWEKNYAARALDFGEGSDQTQNTIWRLKNLDVKGYKPKVAVLMIGTNNYNDPAEDIAAGVKAVISTTQETFPGIKIILVSILPNQRGNDKTTAANELIKKFADDKTVFYLDLAAKFTPDGDNWKGLGKDHLHLTTQGYEMWAAELDPLLAKLLPK